MTFCQVLLKAGWNEAVSEVQTPDGPSVCIEGAPQPCRGAGSASGFSGKESLSPK